MQILDDKRGRFATLDAPSFECMTVAMKIFLDKCQSPRRVKCALRLANMSITFHKQKQILVSSESTTTTKTDTKTDSDSDSDTPQHNHYVQCEPEINQHELWHTAGFWEDALSHGLREQMVMMDPVQWDELEPELLNEKVMGTQQREGESDLFGIACVLVVLSVVLSGVLQCSLCHTSPYS